MKKRVELILLSFMIIVAGCTKKEPTRTSGTDTIDNITHFSTTYFNYGFSFSSAKLLSTNLNPGPDITLFLNTGNVPPTLTLQTNNLKPSFYKLDDYPDESSAKTAFDNLKAVSVTQWLDMAEPILANQVWIYRSGSDVYTKFRIISLINETRQSVPYGEITFQWITQPDGSSTFPGK